MSRLSISSWSLHCLLGRAHYSFAHAGSDRLLNSSDARGELDLLDLPALIATHGNGTLELCHFHVPSIDPSYIAEFRARLDAAGVELFSILIDTGDISQPDPARREADMALTKRWIELAGKFGATRVRVGAGDTPPDPEGETVRRSADNLRALARFAADHGIRVITENWKKLTKRPEPLLEILELCEGEVGLCADFGNFPPGSTRYADLAAILPHAGSIHAKAEYDAGGAMNRADFRHCLSLARDAGFDGPVSLIFGGVGEEWEQLDDMQQEVRRELSIGPAVSSTTG